mmetsp:Transcript_80824/g.229711  ORF Transcript_80824/g.229711 Transcript_80824/m.229711 type:complete len:241 (+) Transcript_80824:269-991(+)
MPDADDDLRRAILNDNVAAVLLALDNGADVDGDAPHEAGYARPLHIALSRGSVAMVALLLERGASLTAPDESGNSAFHHVAIRAGFWSPLQFDMVNAIMKAEDAALYVDLTDHGGATSLMIALQSDNEMLAMHLIEHGADFELAATSMTDELALDLLRMINNYLSCPVWTLPEYKWLVFLCCMQVVNMGDAQPITTLPAVTANSILEYAGFTMPAGLVRLHRAKGVLKGVLERGGGREPF